MIKILITGANGLLGQKLTLLLGKKENIDTIATARRPLSYSLEHAKFHVLDVTDRNETEKIILEVKPDVVVHTAAMTQVDQCETDRETCWNVNVTGVKNLVDACEKVKTFLVHVSTDFVFDGTHGAIR